MGTLSGLVTKTGLLKQVGAVCNESEFANTFPEGAVLSKFSLPDHINESLGEYVPSLGAIIEQDLRTLFLNQIDFADMKIIQINLGEWYTKIREIPEIRLGVRELAVLLSDFEKHGVLSVLEHLRITQGVTELAFPGTLMYFSHAQPELYGMYSALYNEHEKNWKLGPRILGPFLGTIVPIACLDPKTKEYVKRRAQSHFFKDLLSN